MSLRSGAIESDGYERNGLTTWKLKKVHYECGSYLIIEQLGNSYKGRMIYKCGVMRNIS
jgi:hypothetical protein